MSLLNCTNHPVSGWPASQVEAARQGGLGEPTDIRWRGRAGLPLVPAEWAIDAVRTETTD